MVISIIVVSYNTAELTVQAVKSVFDNLQEDKITGEVILIDNDSTDDSVVQLKKAFKDLVIIENAKNTGFASANNQGMKQAKGQYFLLLNSDTILHQHALKHLLDTFDRYPEIGDSESLEHTQAIDRLGIISGQLQHQDGSIQVQGGALPTVFNISAWWLWPFPGALPLGSHSYHQESPAFFETERKTGWVGGTAMMIKREVVEEIGYLDEGIFMYAEDVELCVRASKHHWDVLITPLAKITHFGSASSGAQHALIGEVKGLLFLAHKHFSFSSARLLTIIFWLGALLRYVLFGIILNNEVKKDTYKRILAEISSSSES